MLLERFHQAQASQGTGYATALAEIRRGGKCSHWIWYVFPQLNGLGRSSIAREFALQDLDEACAYLRDPLLRARYEEITATVADQLAKGDSIESLMGSSTDALKLVSSLTLFRAAAFRLAQGEAESGLTLLARRCDFILGQAATQGYEPCQFTIRRCAG